MQIEGGEDIFSVVRSQRKEEGMRPGSNGRSIWVRGKRTTGRRAARSPSGLVADCGFCVLLAGYVRHGVRRCGLRSMSHALTRRETRGRHTGKGW